MDLRSIAPPVASPRLRSLCAKFTLALLGALAPLGLGCAAVPRAAPAEPPAVWKKLATEPYKGKQDDIFFVDPQLGFYVNGAGRIYKTTDGGESWRKVLDQPGTYFRTIGFLDAQNGFAGNIGTDYFPGVTDKTPLYQTHDGGETWSAVAALQDKSIHGLCAIDVLHVDFINAGHLDQRAIIHAAGRVGGPAVLLTSLDQGKTWEVQDLSAQASMILDVKFLDSQKGFLCAGTAADVDNSHALVLMTLDGGKSWSKQYESTRPFETTWKCSFPSREVGYATVQNYDERVAQRVVAKTVDGGLTWKEIPLVSDAKEQEFGIAFDTPELGWVGAMSGAYFTRDGGQSFTRVAMGKAVNKIRLLRTPDGLVGYAIGTEVFKLSPAR